MQQQPQDPVMRVRFSMTMAVAAAVVVSLIAYSTTSTPAQAPLKTPWGEPDLQGIWTYEFDTPLQRLAKYASQEFFTEDQRAELDRERAAMLARDGRQRSEERRVGK